MKKRSLDQIYASLPKIACKGLCSESCGPIDFTKEERERMEATFGRAIGKVDRNLSCPALACGQCMVYESRPLICRLWGLTPAMPCPFGCVPERVVPEEESLRLLAEVGMLSAADSETTSPISASERVAIWQQNGGGMAARQAYEQELMGIHKGTK